MGIQNLAENVIFIVLTDEQKIGDELKAVNEFVNNRRNINVIIDFSRVEVVNSSNISNLIILHNLLRQYECWLILCNVAVPTKCIFTVVGLDKFFVFADDKQAALEIIKNAGQTATVPTAPDLEVKNLKSSQPSR